MREILKPCPFCASDRIEILALKDFISPFRAVCCSCGCGGKVGSGTREEALEGWNRRAPLAPPVESDAAPSGCDLRETFEAWAEAHGYDLTRCDFVDADVYRQPDTQGAWRGYQAAQPPAQLDKVRTLLEANVRLQAIIMHAESTRSIRQHAQDCHQILESLSFQPSAQAAELERLVEENSNLEMALDAAKELNDSKRIENQQLREALQSAKVALQSLYDDCMDCRDGGGLSSDEDEVPALKLGREVLTLIAQLEATDDAK